MLTLIVVVGSVMAYGAVAVLFLPMNRSNALSMVFMVVPMTVLMFVSLRFVLRKIQGRMDLLTDALRQVAGGNLSVRLDEANAGEYAASSKHPSPPSKASPIICMRPAAGSSRKSGWSI